MTTEQCKAFLSAIESAGITAYEFGSDVSATRLYNDGKTAIAKPIYDKEAVIGFRNKTSYGGSMNAYDKNIEVIISDFVDIHTLRTAGDYDQIKKFSESFGTELSEDEYNILLQIDKKNLDIIPETGDYNRFKYLTQKQYDALSDEEKAAYDSEKKAYEEALNNYTGKNQAAMITL